MRHHSAVLVLVLAAGTTASLSAQSREFTFRRFGSRNMVGLQRDLRPLRFSFDNSHTNRFRLNADRFRDLARVRSLDLAAQARNRDFYRRDLEMRLRNRDFALRDEARRRQMELRYRQFDRLRVLRPMALRRHGRTI